MICVSRDSNVDHVRFLYAYSVSRLHKIGKQNPNLGSSTENGDDDGDSPDMTAIVSALANQQSEDELSLASGANGHHHNMDSMDSLDVAHMQYVPKDLHHLSRMFIQANLLPRPRSESNFQVRLALVTMKAGY